MFLEKMVTTVAQGIRLVANDIKKIFNLLA